MGVALLVGLGALAALAAIAWAERAYADGRASEKALVAATLFLLALLAPAQALGNLGALTAGGLAGTSLVVSLAALAAAWAGPGATARIRLTLALLRTLARMPFEAAALTARGRSFTFVAFAGAAFVAAYTAALAYLAPSSSWDGTWYHDSLVGFAIQEHGFAPIALPPAMQHVNGYPRSVELLMVWLSIFTDRRMIDAVGSLTAPLLWLAFYVIARRFSTWRAGAIAFASLVFLIPAVALQCRSTYIDGVVATLLTVAAAFVTRPVLRARDAFLATAALALFGSSKGTGLVIVPLFALILLVRLLRSRASRPGAKGAAVAAGTALLLAFMAPQPLRNLGAFGNALWPYPFESKTLGIKVDGQARLPVHNDAAARLAYLLDPPHPGLEFPDTRHTGFGVGSVTVIYPIGALALVLAAAWAAHRRPHPRRRTARAVLLVALPLLLSCATSPAIWWARYAIQGPIALFALAFFVLRAPTWRAFAEGAVGAVTLVSLLGLSWSTPAWDVGWKRAFELAEQTPAERAAARFNPWQPEPAVAQARDAELGPGDVLTFPNNPGFPGVYWNERFSNRLVWVPLGRDAATYLAALDVARAKWAVVEENTAEKKAVEGSRAWQRVGKISANHVAFRRTPPAPAR